MATRSYLIPLALICWAAYLFAGRVGPARESQTAATTRASHPVLTALNTTEVAAHDQATQAWIDELAMLEADRAKRERAEAKLKDAQVELQIAASTAWSGLLARNWQGFQALREQAAGNPTRTTPCTLCDGQGHMDSCILCRNNNGKCVTCAGTGEAPPNEYCPVCLGSAACRLCFGTGKMSCPFCDEGIINLRYPLPPNMIPVD